MFEVDQDTAEAVGAIISLASQYKKGSCIPHPLIAEACGEPCKTDRYFYLLRKASRRIMRERKIQTWVLREVGLRLLDDAEIPDYLRHKRRKAISQNTKAKMALKVVDRSRLTLHQLKLIDMENQRVANERRELLRSSRSIAGWLRNPGQSWRSQKAEAK